MPVIYDIRTIKINGIEFTPIPGVNYKYNYIKVVDGIKSGKYVEEAIYRQLILEDLWFVVYFVVGNTKANHPFIVEAVKEFENGPKDMTLDVWGREHLKSTVITTAETIQYQLKNPNHCTCIFSHKASVAKKFVFALKVILEGSEILKRCFPHVIWKKADRDAPIWSLDEGLILKRDTNRREPSIMAAGLIEGMPVGLHFDRLIFDDIVTQDMANSFDMMEKVKVTFDMAQSIGTDGGTQRVIGTYYHHADPLIYIRDKHKLDKTPLYHLRLKPATEGGESNGKSVFLSEEYLDKMRATSAFNSQYLLNPTPMGIKKFTSSLLRDIDRKDVPEFLYRFMVIDSAGEDKMKHGDSWAMLVIGVDPEKDDIGASNIYILDAVISPFKVTEALEEVVRMYLRNGAILQVGVEKVGAMTIDLNVSEWLEKYGRRVNLEEKTLKQLSPAGREKDYRIETALAWPFSNGKIFMCDDIPNTYRQRIWDEMNRFPFWYKDGLDALAYVYDMIRDNRYWLRPLKKHSVIQMKSLGGEHGWLAA